MKQIKHVGSYGLILENNKILLINKKGGPYDGKLDLPGGTIEYGETPVDTLVRELKEEVGIDVLSYKLFDGNSATIRWIHHDELEEVTHIGFFYIINKYSGAIKSVNKIDDVNDDSMGARFYDINSLSSDMLSSIADIEINKLKNIDI